MKESDFLLVGSKKEQKFDYPAVKAIFDSNETLRSDFQYLGLSDVYAVQGFYRMGKDGFLAFSKGAKINTDDGAQLEFSAPKTCPTLDFRRIAARFSWIVRLAEKRSLAGFSSDASFYLAQSGGGRAFRALTELEERPLEPN
jgi:hypothetical protein